MKVVDAGTGADADAVTINSNASNNHDGRLVEDQEGLTNAKQSTPRERTPVLLPPSTSCVSHHLENFDSFANFETFK